MLKYFYRVKICPRVCCVPAPGQPETETRGPLAAWHRPAAAATPPYLATLPHVTTRDTAGILGSPDSYAPYIHYYYCLCEWIC